MMPFYIALAEIGTKETKGKRATKRILEYYKACNEKLHISSDEVPWCAAFVGWCLKQAGLVGTGLLTARSYSRWGDACKPKMGCIVVLKRGKSKWQGHVGFLIKKTSRFVYILGGNQNNQVKISRYYLKDVLDYRK